MSEEVQRCDPFDDAVGTGLLGRMTNVLTRNGFKTSSIALDAMSKSIMGSPESSPATVINKEGVSRFNPKPSSNQMNAVIEQLNGETMSKSGLFGETFSSQLHLSLAQNEALYQSLEQSHVEKDFPKTNLGSQLEIVSRLVKARNDLGIDRDVFFVTLDKFDTHSNAGSRLASLFGEANDAMEAFVDEMKAQGMFENVALVATSEFARTLSPNSSEGSDHGWGGNYFTIGGKVNGGRILGRYPDDLSDDGELSVGRGRIIPTTSWDSFWHPMIEWFGIDDERDMNEILPNRGNFAGRLLSQEDIFVAMPSDVPSTAPSDSPSMTPSREPSSGPSTSSAPSSTPSLFPTTSGVPSTIPSNPPSVSSIPSPKASHLPSVSTAPSSAPSTLPSNSAKPSSAPSHTPSGSGSPSTAPSASPSLSASRTRFSSNYPSSSAAPSIGSSGQPSRSAKPSHFLLFQPSAAPSLARTSLPSTNLVPSSDPYLGPSHSGSPSIAPSLSPSMSVDPTTFPSTIPSLRIATSSVGPSEQTTTGVKSSDFPTVEDGTNALPSATQTDLPSTNFLPSGDPSPTPSRSGFPSTARSQSPSTAEAGRSSDIPSSRIATPSIGPSEEITASTKPSAFSTRQQGISTAPSMEHTHLPSIGRLPSQLPSGSSGTSAIPSGAHYIGQSESNRPSAVPSDATSSLSQSQKPSTWPITMPIRPQSSAPSDFSSMVPSVHSGEIPSSDGPSTISRPLNAPSEEPTKGIASSYHPSEPPRTSAVPSISPIISAQPSGYSSSQPSRSDSPGTPSVDSLPSSLPSNLPIVSDIPPSLSPVAPQNETSSTPTYLPNGVSSSGPSIIKSTYPSGTPSASPLNDETSNPSDFPSASTQPTEENAPSYLPSTSSRPNVHPSYRPSKQDSYGLHGGPSRIPSFSYSPARMTSKPTTATLSVFPSAAPQHTPTDMHLSIHPTTEIPRPEQAPTSVQYAHTTWVDSDGTHNKTTCRKTADQDQGSVIVVKFTYLLFLNAGANVTALLPLLERAMHEETIEEFLICNLILNRVLNEDKSPSVIGLDTFPEAAISDRKCTDDEQKATQGSCFVIEDGISLSLQGNSSSPVVDAFISYIENLSLPSVMMQNNTELVIINQVSVDKDDGATASGGGGALENGLESGVDDDVGVDGASPILIGVVVTVCVIVVAIGTLTMRRMRMKTGDASVLLVEEEKSSTSSSSTEHPRDKLNSGVVSREEENQSVHSSLSDVSSNQSLNRIENTDGEVSAMLEQSVSSDFIHTRQGMDTATPQTIVPCGQPCEQELTVSTKEVALSSDENVIDASYLREGSDLCPHAHVDSVPPSASESESLQISSADKNDLAGIASGDGNGDTSPVKGDDAAETVVLPTDQTNVRYGGFDDEVRVPNLAACISPVTMDNCAASNDVKEEAADDLAGALTPPSTTMESDVDHVGPTDDALSVGARNTSCDTRYNASPGSGTVIVEDTTNSVVGDETQRNEDKNNTFVDGTYHAMQDSGTNLVLADDEEHGHVVTHYAANVTPDPNERGMKDRMIDQRTGRVSCSKTETTTKYAAGVEPQKLHLIYPQRVSSPHVHDKEVQNKPPVQNGRDHPLFVQAQYSGMQSQNLHLMYPQRVSSRAPQKAEETFSSAGRERDPPRDPQVVTPDQDDRRTLQGSTGQSDKKDTGEMTTSGGNLVSMAMEYLKHRDDAHFSSFQQWLGKIETNCDSDSDKP